MRLRWLALAPLVALSACDLFFPDYRIEVEGTVRDGDGAPVAEATVTLRRSRSFVAISRFDTPLASVGTDAAGAYRLTHDLEGCAGVDRFRVVAERVVGTDTTQVSGAVACANGVQEVDLVLAAPGP